MVLRYVIYLYDELRMYECFVSGTSELNPGIMSGYPQHTLTNIPDRLQVGRIVLNKADFDSLVNDPDPWLNDEVNSGTMLQ